ncbi:gametocyte-specific factor 1 isoform X1 [Archocentrus centrarchus]|uniref:gametocyte-specific factor 1-like isoform X1 n=1 Tax=Archocentrus centrarchus TaxID=63155 RepID=UPI0011E9EA30|nr:gametocyte-specific factor 1-like isoform X1 [Archocentrus centrarchus]XP_030590360.1 gametocyte-specific factor 1-like isoform X1 [Archocentrus centrarchus]
MASNMKSGTTTTPSRTPHAEGAQEENDKGNADPEKLLQCPFDKSHQIRTCRFPYHLIKCRKNHPNLASELKTCPFNARHLVHKHELAHHTETCEDRISVDTEEAGSANGAFNWHVPVSTWMNPNMAEDWDDEADDAAIPFVWGEAKMPDLIETRPTSNLGPSFRSPSTLPWPGFKQ